MHYESFKNLTAGIQSITTSLALVGGGGWAYWRFVLNRESAHKVDLDADVNFVRKQGDNWVIEGVAWVKNPGNVRLDFKEFTRELGQLFANWKYKRDCAKLDKIDPRWRQYHVMWWRRD